MPEKLTEEELEEIFNNDFDSNFEDFVKNKKNSKQFNHALLLLMELMPNRSVIAGADHDIIFLTADVRNLAGSITLQQAQELRVCGVFQQNDGLCMFV